MLSGTRQNLGVKVLVAAAAALSLSTLTGCAATVSEAEARQLRKDVDALRATLARDEQRLSDLSNQLFIVSDQLSQLSRRQQQLQSDTAVPPALEVVKLVPGGGEGTRERGSAERPSSRGGAANDAETAAAGASNDEAGDEPAVDVVVESESELASLPVAAVPPPPPFAHHAPDGEPERLMRDGLAAFREGKSDKAISLFQRLVDRYPRHASADAALYFMGEARLEAREYALAINHFRTLRERYPNSSKAADALFKLGIAYERSNDLAQARRAFEELCRAYPDSPLAELARARREGAFGGARGAQDNAGVQR